VRLLLTAELGKNPDWFSWLDEGAENYDLVVIAGDFLDVFRPEPFNVQIAQAEMFLRSLAQKTCVAISSGNHDTVDCVAPSPRGPVPTWMAGLDSIDTLVSDGVTSVIREQLIVSSLSYISTVDRKRSWLAQAAELRKKTDLPWLVIHHHSPVLEGSANPEEFSAGKLLKEFGPTLWIAGCFFDDAPARPFNWIQTVNKSVVLNISQASVDTKLREAAFPNHVDLDLAAGILQWNSWLESTHERRSAKLS
jgi:hypothetical protein